MATRVAWLVILLGLAGCGKAPVDLVYSIEYGEVPRFVRQDFVEIDKISRIGKFRSAVGHDYSDSFESGRSMKHAYQPEYEYVGTNDALNLFAPVAGLIVHAGNERVSGKQIRIRPDGYPYILITIFHVNTTLEAGKRVEAGQIIGHADLRGTNSFEIAVWIATDRGNQLVSWFDVMTDELFSSYQRRGIPDRQTMIISKEFRDTHPSDSSSNHDDEWVEFLGP